MKTVSGRKASQKKYELDNLIRVIKENKCKTYLEIGARDGDTFYEIMKSLPVGSKGIAVDYPGASWGHSLSAESLKRVISTLKHEGYDVDLVLGDSTRQTIIDVIKKHSDSYDAILIDGDHRYDGVKQDWDNYGPMATKIVAFHDIWAVGARQKNNPHLIVEVPKLWEELKPLHKHDEFIDKEDEPSRPMGIGVLYIIP